LQHSNFNICHYQSVKCLVTAVLVNFLKATAVIFYFVNATNVIKLTLLTCFLRKDTKTLCLKNKTMLPVAWRLTGLEVLGDDFSVSQEGGVIQPKSEFVLSVYFRALKPIVTNKKAIRIEVIQVVIVLGNLCYLQSF